MKLSHQSQLSILSYFPQDVIFWSGNYKIGTPSPKKSLCRGKGTQALFPLGNWKH